MKKYIWMIVIGFVLTISFIATIWLKDAWNTIFNIFAMIGSGLLCSAVVSYIIEASNYKRDENLKQEQQKYILSSVQDSLLWLFSLEYKNLSEYLTLSNTTNKYKTNKEELEVEKVLNEISDYLRQITNNTSICFQFTNVIDSNYLTRIKRRDNLAFKNNLPFYEKLNKELLKIYEDSNYYLTIEILGEEQLRAIHDLQIDVDQIIYYSNENNLDALFEFKEIFIANISKNLSLFNIKESDKIICYDKVISNK